MPNNYLPRLLQIRPQYTPNKSTATEPQNIIWFLNQSAGTPSIANLSAISSAFDTAWKAYWLEWGGQDASYLGSITTDWSSNLGLSFDSRPTFTAVPGTKGESMAGSVAILVSYQVAMRWRGGHFRTYLPYVGLSNQDSADPNKISAATQTLLNSGLNSVVSAMFATGVLGGQQWVLYKQKQKGVPPETFPITTYNHNLLLASQRRRLRKVTRK